MKTKETTPDKGCYNCGVGKSADYKITNSKTKLTVDDKVDIIFKHCKECTGWTLVNWAPELPEHRGSARKFKEQPLKDDLSNYDETAWKSPSVTCDICICRVTNRQLQVLLIKRRYPPFRGYWAIVGGFLDVDKNETLEQTAKRELLEETNLKGIDIEQLKTYGDIGRDPRKRVITVAYYALLSEKDGAECINHLRAGDDAAEAQWFDLRNLPKLAFDHETILKDLLDRLMGKISYSPLAFQLVPTQFTWKELQEVYQVVLGHPMMAGNFRRKILSQYILGHLNKDRPTGGRPAKLLRYESQKEF